MKENTTRTLALAIITSLVTSCSGYNFYKRSSFPPKRALALDPANRSHAVYVAPLSYRYSEPALEDDSRPYFRTAYESAVGDNVKRDVRNNIAKELVALVDENHAFYHDSLRRAVSTNSILGDFFKIGFDTASVISAGEHAKTALSALGAASTGMSSSFNARTLQKQTIATLLKAIQIRKEREFARMLVNFDEPTSDYSLNDVLVNIGRYWEAGLIGSGLAEIEQITTKRVKAIEDAKDQSAGQAAKARGQAILTAE